MKVSWLDRSLMTGPYLALVLSDEEFQAAMKHCGIAAADRSRWIKTDHSDATAHFLENPKREMCCVVAIRVDGQTPIQVAAILVHEAVHIFQSYCERIGENSPSPEFEAYSIQMLSQRLMQGYADRVEAAK